jgi:transcriptional regulator with GAF, ATPase, and Fis domain
MQPTKLVGASPAIIALQEEVHYAAKCDAKVLITGESGAGKEIVARLIHSSSARSRSTLVTVNCAALSETLLETELFGHVRGSFTGAYRDRLGAFEQAHRGTVFMDEIGETSPRMQGLLLRFLETGEIQRVGSDQVQNRPRCASGWKTSRCCWTSSSSSSRGSIRSIGRRSPPRRCRR